MNAPRVRLVPMTPDEFDAFARRSISGFAAQQVASGSQPAVEADRYAEEQFALLLPDGPATPLHHQWSVVHEDVVVGDLWVRVRPWSRGVQAYLFDVHLRPAARGRGLGRATMLACETASRDLGATVLQLNVFGHNLPALRLYESLGYAVTESYLTRRVEGAWAASPDSGPVELRAMATDEAEAFVVALEAGHAAALVRSGALPPVEAGQRAAGLAARLRTRGDGSRASLWTAYAGGHPVGSVGWELTDRSDGRHADLVALPVEHGGAVLRAAARVWHAEGVTSAGVSVPGCDEPALSLARRSGFEVTARSMTKPLAGR